MILDRTKEFVIPSIEQINEEGKPRVYKTPSGKKYPSITSVTGILSKEAIQEWRTNVGEVEANRVSRIASTRGTRLHLLAELYITNQTEDFEQTFKKSMIDVTMMWKGLRKKIDAGLTEVLASEARLWSDELEVAGTVDCIGKFFGKYAIIDFKTSRKQKYKADITGYFLQAAAYTQMWYERTGMKIDHLIVLIATEETNKTYLFHEPADVWIPKFKELRETYRKIYNL